MGLDISSSSASPVAQAMVIILLDRSGRIDERDDAAMDLAAFDDPGTEHALITVLMDETEEDMIVESAAESLSEIWARQERSNASLISRMPDIAKPFFRDQDENT